MNCGITDQSLSQVLIWVFTGSGIVLTAGRYIIRLKTVKTFKADDYVHGLALIVLICYVSTYTVMLPLNYAVEFWIAGTGKPPSEADLRRFVHLEIAIATQFLVVMYLVKLAFLLFYWSIFNVSRLFMKAWWLVTIFTLLTFLANFIAVFWSCVTPRDFLVLGVSSGPKMKHYREAYDPQSDVFHNKRHRVMKRLCLCGVDSTLRLM